MSLFQKMMGIELMADPDCQNTKVKYKCKSPTLPSLCQPKKVVWEYYVDSKDSSMVCDHYESDHCCNW